MVQMPRNLIASAAGFGCGYILAEFLYKTLSPDAKSAPFEHMGEHAIRFAGPLVPATIVAVVGKGLVRYGALAFAGGSSLKWIFMDELPNIAR